MSTLREKVIYSMQLGSMMGIWLLLGGIIFWLYNSLRLAFELDDLPTTTVAITIVAMVVFAILVSILTYVFVGLQMGREEVEPAIKEEGQ